MKRFLVGLIAFGVVAGVVYLATLGCCELMAGGSAKPGSLARQLGLTLAQGRVVAGLESQFMAKKTASCRILCAKRAQLIQSLKDPEPDRMMIATLVEEIGREQTGMERATIDHLLAVGQQLDPSQRQRLTNLMTEQLRTACKATACGATPGCALADGSR